MKLCFKQGILNKFNDIILYLLSKIIILCSTIIDYKIPFSKFSICLINNLNKGYRKTTKCIILNSNYNCFFVCVDIKITY